VVAVPEVGSINMCRIRLNLLTLAIFVLIGTNLMASALPTCGNVGTGSSAPHVCWKDPPPGAQAAASATVPACSGATPFVQCGYFYLSATGWNQLPASTYGWHSWNGSQNLTTFLNGLSNLRFSLTSSAGMYECPKVQNLAVCANRNLYVNPTQDYGYFLSTANVTSVPGITITFPAPYIKGFTLLWGSVDQWNTVTLTDSNGVSYSVSGDQLPQFTSYNLVGGTSTMSELVQFTLQSNSDAPWTSVSFSSCNSTRTICGPAFEFDDIEWETACTTNCGVTRASSPAAVPEPGSLALLGIGLVGGVGRLRRRIGR